MDPQSDTAIALRALTYGISGTTDAHALHLVDDAFKLINQRAGGFSPTEFLAAIREALASAVNLASVIPGQVTDPVIRQYLREVEKQLAARIASDET